MLSVNPAYCPQNHRCPLVAACPVGAITQEGFGLPHIDNDTCIECGYCSAHCPKQAVRHWNE